MPSSWTRRLEPFIEALLLASMTSVVSCRDAPSKPLPSARFAHAEQETLLEDLQPTWGLSWVDADSDGLPDLYYAVHMLYASPLWLNQDGLYFKQSLGREGLPAGADDHSAGWADFDGDGRMDFFPANGYFTKGVLHRNTPTGFEEASRFSEGLVRGRYRSALWADLSGDGWDDLMISGWESPDQLLLSKGGGHLADATLRSGVQNAFPKHGMLAGDIDNDGDLDLVALIDRGALVFTNRGDGTFVETSLRQPQPIAGMRGDIGDVDNDGDVDIVTIDSGGSVFLNDGNGRFTKAKRLKNAREPIALSLADLDNDGDLDLLALVGKKSRSVIQGTIAYYENQGTGVFRNRTRESGLDSDFVGDPMAVAFADFNGDGYLDFSETNGRDGVQLSGPHLLLRNVGGTAASVRIFPERAIGSRDGFGAQIDVVLPSGRHIVRDNVAIHEYGQDQEGVHVGLGKADHVAQVCASWPDGAFACQQGVPSGSAILRAGPRGHVIESHPAALLSDRALPSLDPVERFVTGKGVVSSNIDEGVLATERQVRRERLIAFAYAQEVSRSLAVDSNEITNYYKDDGHGFRRPAHRWLESLTYKMSDYPKEQLQVEAERAAVEVRAGASVLKVALEGKLNAWRSFSADKRQNLVEGRRGWVEAGWVRDDMLRTRFDTNLARSLQNASAQSFVGLTTHFDVRRWGGKMDLVSIFHIGAVDTEAVLPLAERRADLERALKRRKLRAALALHDSSNTPSVPSDVDMIDGVRYSIRELAERGRAEGYEQKPEIQRAMLRIDEEIRVDAALVQWATTVQPEEVTGIVSSYAPLRASAEHLKGVHLFFTRREAAEAARAALVSGEPLDSVRKKFDIRTLTSISGRFHNQYVEPFDFDVERLAHRVGEPGVKAVLALSPGSSSEVIEFEGTFHVVLFQSRASEVPWSDDAANARARREAARRRLQQASSVAIANERR